MGNHDDDLIGGAVANLEERQHEIEQELRTLLDRAKPLEEELNRVRIALSTLEGHTQTFPRLKPKGGGRTGKGMGKDGRTIKAHLIDAFENNKNPIGVTNLWKAVKGTYGNCAYGSVQQAITELRDSGLVAWFPNGWSWVGP